MLGEFNKGCGYLSKEGLQGLDISGPDGVWTVPHSVDMNVAGSHCAYDRIVMHTEGTEGYAGVRGSNGCSRTRVYPSTGPSRQDSCGLGRRRIAMVADWHRVSIARA